MTLRGFGFEYDVRTGRTRQWYYKDGEKHWVDDTQPPARCDGVQYDGEWRDGCESCKRRTLPADGREVVKPEPIIVFMCPWQLDDGGEL